MNLKVFIKVPLVVIENIVFTLLPPLRSLVEKYIFNPLDFKADHINYSRKKFTDFKKNLTHFTDLKEKVFLELGPGGFLGTGILALEAGVKEYIALDNGVHTFIQPKQTAYYRELLDQKSKAFHRYFVTQNQRTTYRKDKISFVSINQTSRYPLTDASVDIIYSCAVLEHVHNLDLCFEEMARVLKPGGYMYHEVDLRDHIFSQKSLWFLTLPDWLFRLLFRNTGGYVNRKRLSAYRTLAEKYDFRICTLTVTEKARENTLPKKLRAQYSEEDQDALVFTAIFQKT